MNVKSKSVFLTLILLVFSSISFAQEEKTSEEIDDFQEIMDKSLKKHRYSFSYLGNNGIRPGISSRAELSLKTKVKNRNSRRYLLGKKIDRVHTKEFLFSKNGGFYIHPNSHAALIRNWGIGYRKTRTKGWEYQADIYPVGFQLFILSETYSVNNDGEVSKKSLPLSLFYTPGVSFSFGKKFKNQNKAREAWHVRTSINALTNYNNTVVPSVNLELGLRFNSSKLIKSYINNKTK